MSNSSSITHSTRLELLTRSNYDTWRIQAEALFVKNDSWAYVSGESPAPTISEGTSKTEDEKKYKTWLGADRNAKADLILSISPSELKLVKGCITANDVWKKLETTFASQGPARKATLLKSLIHHKMKEGDDVHTMSTTSLTRWTNYSPWTSKLTAT